MKVPGFVTFAILVIGFAGCGSGKQESKNGAAFLSLLALSSGAIESDTRLSSSYICNPDSVWFPLEWHGVPQGTAELVVVIGVSSTVKNAEGTVSRFRNQWVIAGINPGESRLTVGAPPLGAYVMRVHRNTRCPESNSEIGIASTLYAMPVLHSRQEYERYATNAALLRFNALSIAADRVVGVYSP